MQHRPRIDRACASPWLRALAVLAVAVTSWLLAPGLSRAKGKPAEPPPFEIAATPSWVEPVPESSTRFASEQARAGVGVRMIDSQVRVTKKTEWWYLRLVREVTSEAGTSLLGQVTIDFRPPHERLVLHRLDVHRGDEVLARLSEDVVEVLQRERSLEERLYDGLRTAVIVLPDIRVGDVIVQEYSIVGSNPVLDGHFSASPQLQSGLPIGALHYLVSSERPLEWRTWLAEDPEIDVVGGMHRYRWLRHDVPASLDVADLPADEQTSSAQLTDMQSWADVGDWGRELFRVPSIPEPVQEVVDSIRAEHESDAARAIAAIRFVQDDVRYFAMSLGEGSHRPADPAVVLERRFGDCKDKSMLLATLLRGLGIPAELALVRTSGGGLLPSLLPSIRDFDHVIVAIEVGGRRWFIDPTEQYVRGPLASMQPRGFHHALIIGEAGGTLTPIDETPQEVADIDAKLVYSFDQWGGPVRLDVETTFGDGTATAVRAARAAQDAASFAETFLATVRETHPEAEAVGELSYVDHEDERGIVTAHSYRLDPWSTLADGAKQIATFPIYERDRLPALAPDREAPLALPSPLAIRHEIEIHTPDIVELTPTTVDVDEGPIHVHFRSSSQGKVVRIEHGLEVVASRVEVADLPALRETLRIIDENLEFALWHSPGVAPPVGTASFNWTVFLVAALWTVLLLVGVVIVHVKAPYLRRPEVEWDPTLVGIRGFLAVLSIRVTLGPFLIIRDFWEILPSYGAETWSALTTPGTETYSAWWGPTLLFELLGNLALVVGTSYLVYAFWSRRRSFPLLFVVVQAATLAVQLLDQVLVNVVAPEATDLAEPTEPSLAAFVIAALLWIMYVLRSRRVRATFLPPPSDEVGEPGASRRDRFDELLRRMR